MSNCALAIANAVADVYKGYNGAPKHYWCVFHVLKAFRGKAKSYLGEQWSEAFWEFRSIMYLHDDPTGAFASFMVCWGQVSPRFLGYVQRQWANRLQNWAVFFQTVSPHLKWQVYLTADSAFLRCQSTYSDRSPRSTH
jgi:hypothetical protein